MTRTKQIEEILKHFPTLNKFFKSLNAKNPAQQAETFKKAKNPNIFVEKILDLLKNNNVLKTLDEEHNVLQKIAEHLNKDKSEIISIAIKKYILEFKACNNLDSNLEKKQEQKEYNFKKELSKFREQNIGIIKSLAEK